MLADPEAYRQSMRRWTTGVTIITCCHNGFQHGMTVSSFMSISVSPPMVLVAIQRDSRTQSLIKHARIFGVTVLAEDQIDLSERFAGRTGQDEDRLLGIDTFTMVTGSPFIRGGLAYLDCEVSRALAIGINSLFIGNVVALETGQDGKPLLYYERSYRFLRDELR